ncbi:tetratricopeptide repeat protein [Alteromonas ponticola]|uniref:Tetratricopeptide repeat protein n=1 Tax=Alteromonas ponticola TaxID=2720613 RepID=A0ABX1R6E4_9ALTE|nr:tetratricopeptide repeat protein [Alteromonas ponticola]NMH61496.1 hypothetical protein [Alteromonas ponticola]
MSSVFRRLAILFIIWSGIVTGTQQCVDCHAEAVSDWQTSDHAKAMATATEQTVLGDFSNQSVNHYSQTARFYKKDDEYFIQFDEGGTITQYRVSYTFGHYPLQQYLIETESGRLQVFPFAWDSRPEQEGGQRWYPIYAEEDVTPQDRLHWLQPLQNWNGMCADCHSDGLKRNYTAGKDQFDTKWDNINVGCQSCHSTMSSTHYREKTSDRSDRSLGMTANELDGLGKWLLNDTEKVAHWKGEARDNRFMQNCFACHSLRSPLTDGFEADKPFLDQFSPILLSQPFYHADGQISEEVYVYGSFLQSKMFREGVNCLDCHDKHTMQVKTDTNGLCLQCHNSNEYQTSSHLNHPIESEGAQCVNCHMPENTYMGVDSRRDHSFKVPRPELTKELGVPNACNGCHQDESVNWAIEKVAKMYGHKNPFSSNEKAYIRLQHGEMLTAEQHLAIINDESLNEIYRASTIALLPNSFRTLNDSDIKEWVTSELPLIRLATAQIGNLLPVEQRLKTYRQLITDEYKAIRVEAVRHLVGVEGIELASIKSAFDEMMTANEINLWRGEGALNMSLIQMQMQQYSAAIQSLRHAIDVDPYFDVAYINLADIYRAVGAIQQEQQILEQGLDAVPGSATLHYSFAMFRIRQGQKQAAVDLLAKAIKLEPHNVQFAYVYFIALDDVGKTRQALAMLKMTLNKYQNNQTLIELGLSLARKLNDRKTYNELIKLLRH